MDLGGSWARFGRVLGGSGGASWGSWALLGRSWGALGAILEHSLDTLGLWLRSLGGLWLRFYFDFEGFWEGLGRVLARLGVDLGRILRVFLQASLSYVFRLSFALLALGNSF